MDIFNILLKIQKGIYFKRFLVASHCQEINIHTSNSILSIKLYGKVKLIILATRLIFIS